MAYDVRGRVPEELNEGLAGRIGRAYAACFSPGKVVVGRDVRLSSPALAGALINGLLAAGVNVLDLGLCGSEEVYFATFQQPADGGIMVTASHNPAEYNGMKFVGPGARAISRDSGLREIERLVVAGDFPEAGLQPGRRAELDNRNAYIDHLLGYVESAALKPLRLAVNSGNGGAGPVIDRLAEKLPFDFVRIQHEADGSFPNGVPNPLLPENRAATARAVIEKNADLGIAFDGDFDRCFFFDERGGFIEGYYIVGLLAEAMLQGAAPAKIIHDPRLIWNTRELAEKAGGVPVMSRTGHAFMKERMRREDAVYGGEMSAHHYFRAFGYCDSGMIPWLMVCEILCRTGKKMSELISDRQAAYPVSGEINNLVDDPALVLRRIEKHFAAAGGARDYTDGLSMEFENFRFNVRSSNTEPLLRLNVETRGDRQLLSEKTELLLRLIRQET